MGIEVIVGPPNSGRAVEVRRRFEAVLEREPVLVVPTRGDVERFERDLCKPGRPVLGASITTFAALADEITRAAATELAPPLSVPQRQALIRAAIRRTAPRRLRRSAARPGFAVALDTLVAELQAALVTPAAFAAEVARLDDPGHTEELARLYAAYIELRDAAGRSDASSLVEAALVALRSDPASWGERPLFIYGFDDLTRAQLELLAALARATDVTVAVNYADRRALSARAGLLSVLTEELGGEIVARLEFDESYTARASLRHLDRHLFEPEAARIPADDGLVLIEAAGGRGEAEAIGLEIARLLATGTEPDDVAVVVRHPESTGTLIAAVLGELGVPAALEASVPLAGTCVGGSLIALCRAAADERDLGALLAHLRSDPALPAAPVDWVERAVLRGEARTVTEATAAWQKPPRHLASLLAAETAIGRLRSIARSARELAEGAHRDSAPLAGAGARAGAGPVPFLATELRAGVAAGELLDELAKAGNLPGCKQPDLADAVEALESASVPAWRGPASGRVRILSPYKVRAGRARYLFCASLQDGDFPTTAPPDPLLADEVRRELGNPDLRRHEQADEERYLFHACVSRPTERLYLSWRSCDEDGGALGRSPFVDEVLDLIGSDPAEAEAERTRVRGLERVVPAPDEAPTARALARALAVRGAAADHGAALSRLGVEGSAAEAVLALFAGLPDPEALPGPLRTAPVLEDLAGRDALSAGSLEDWLGCPYRWFVDHELSPQRLEPESDPLWLGGVVHRALELLYREPPGDDTIARPADLGRWRKRFRDLLYEVAEKRAGAPATPARRATLERLRIQVEAFLEAEAELETELRPRPDLVERGFGFRDDDGEPTPSLELEGLTLHGRIDRIDVARDGVSAVVRDYKTGSSVPAGNKFTEEGVLQIPLYMLVAREVLGLDPIAGLYQPLGATGTRRPRGIALRDERLDALGLYRTDLRDPDTLHEDLEEALERARAAAREMRAGGIGRRPLGDSCPKYCTYQPICRRERVVGAVGEENDQGDKG